MSIKKCRTKFYTILYHPLNINTQYWPQNIKKSMKNGYQNIEILPIILIDILSIKIDFHIYRRTQSQHVLKCVQKMAGRAKNLC